jgi:hypothetical protein
MAKVGEEFGSYIVRRPLQDVEEVSPDRQAPDPSCNMLDTPGTPMRQGTRGQYIGVNFLREILAYVVGVTRRRNDKSTGREKEGRIELLRGKRLLQGRSCAVCLE